MDFSMYVLIGAVIILFNNLLSISSEISKLNVEIKRINRKTDKIMDALNISEYDYDLIDNELKNMISDKGKIKAIKRYRELTGVGLKEAKEYIDKLDEKLI